MDEERWLGLLERLVIVAEQWYGKTYPKEEPIEEAIIHDPKESLTRDPQSRDEYAKLPGDLPGRFTQLIQRSKQAQNSK